MPNLYRSLALSDHWAARLARSTYRSIMTFSLPAPRLITRPILAIVLLLRATYSFLTRVFICEPLFKAYCEKYGKNLRTGSFLHWVQGKGALIIGDDVVVEGKCNFSFAARYSERPTLTIGDGTRIGHDCGFTVGKQIAIGSHCVLGEKVRIFDSPGHAVDPAARLQGLPSSPEEVQPITIGDNVWIGSHSVIMPGVTIGDGSTVARASVVMASVPPNSMVAGNPARQVRTVTSQREAAG